MMTTAMTTLFRRLFRSSTSPALPPAASAVSASPSSFDVEGLLAKIEAKDPNVLHLYMIGDGFLHLKGDEKFEGVTRDPFTTRFGLSRPVFRHQILIANGWDKNGVFYNIDKHLFPYLHTIVLLSHPCEYNVPWRFPVATWICPHGYRRYFEQHPGHVQLSEAQVDRLYKAVNKMPYYTSQRSGSDHHTLFLE